MNRGIRPLLGFLSALAFVAGCASIVGIEDHTFTKEQPSAQCVDYCATVMKNCAGVNAVYTEPELCLGVCKRLPTGNPLEPANQNTVACRLRQARIAENLEPAVNCPSAGPGGDGVCGSNCEAYCKLLQASCATQAGAIPNCEQACSALRDTKGFDVIADHEGDTLQCRLLHVSSATVEPKVHCPHAQLPPSEPWCRDKAQEEPQCEEYCRFNLAGCSGDLAVYESPKQCLDVCKKLDIGKNGDREENTVGCRRYHTYNSLFDPATHCSHTGPGGDGHCGLDKADKAGNCESYCKLAAAACETDFATKYGSTAACEVDCSTQPETFGARADSKYKVSQAQTGNTFQCRMLHVAKAFSDATKCSSAFGGGNCQ